MVNPNGLKRKGNEIFIFAYLGVFRFTWKTGWVNLSDASLRLPLCRGGRRLELGNMPIVVERGREFDLLPPDETWGRDSSSLIAPQNDTLKRTFTCHAERSEALWVYL